MRTLREGKVPMVQLMVSFTVLLLALALAIFLTVLLPAISLLLPITLLLLSLALILPSLALILPSLTPILPMTLFLLSLALLLLSISLILALTVLLLALVVVLHFTMTLWLVVTDRTMPTAGRNLVLIITNAEPRIVCCSGSTGLADGNSTSSALVEVVAIALVRPSGPGLTAGVSGGSQCKQGSGKDSQSFSGELHLDAVRNQAVSNCSDGVKYLDPDDAESHTLNTGRCCHVGIDGLWKDGRWMGG